MLSYGSSFREHQSLMTEFGREADPVSAAVLGFIESVRDGQPVAGLGGERVLKAEGRAAEDAARQLEAYRTRTVLMQFDKNRDGRISRAEMSANPFLFERLDADQDGSVTTEELSVAYEREQPLKKGRPPADPKPTTPSANAGTPADESIGSAGVSYRDPEFLQRGGLVTFAEQNGDVWVGEMDLHTGRFANTGHGRDHRLDGPVSKWSGYCNGPEWGLDAGGPAVFCIKDNSQGTGQLWRAAPPWDRPHLTQLTHDTNITIGSARRAQPRSCPRRTSSFITAAVQTAAMWTPGLTTTRPSSSISSQTGLISPAFPPTHPSSLGRRGAWPATGQRRRFRYLIRRPAPSASSPMTVLIGQRELFVYYTLVGPSGSQLRLCRTGVTKELTQP